MHTGRSVEDNSLSHEVQVSSTTQPELGGEGVDDRCGTAGVSDSVTSVIDNISVTVADTARLTVDMLPFLIPLQSPVQLPLPRDHSRYPYRHPDRCRYGQYRCRHGKWYRDCCRSRYLYSYRYRVTVPVTRTRTYRHRRL